MVLVFVGDNFEEGLVPASYKKNSILILIKGRKSLRGSQKNRSFYSEYV